MAPQSSPACRATSWWRDRKDWTGQGTTVALGPTSVARPIGPSTAYPSMPAGRWGHAGALPGSDSEPPVRPRHLLRARSTLIACVCLLAGSPALSQTVRVLADSGWVSQRIVMLKGMGEVHSPSDSTRLATAVGINLVAPISRREGQRLWIMSTSGGDSGWVDSVEVLRLADAIPYFTRLIERQPDNWDAYLRRAEAEHALNQRDAATADYSKAIELHPAEAFLYLRRGRHYNTLRACDRALSDFDKAITLAPTSAPQGYNLVVELYSLESSVYSGCPDSTRRDPRKAIDAVQRAIALDPSRGGARGFVILAGAYASSGDLAEAIKLMKQALAVPGAAPSHRKEWQRQLDEYQRARATLGVEGPRTARGSGLTCA